MEGKIMSSTSFNPDRVDADLRGFASGAGMKETLKALSFAREKHSGQFRKSGEPYIVHHLMMACNAVSIGIREDADILFVRKYHMVSVVDSIDATIQVLEKESECRPAGTQNV